MFSLGMVALYLLTDLPYKKVPEGKEISPKYQEEWMRTTALPMVDRVGGKFRPLLSELLAYEAKDRWGAQKVINYFWRLDKEFSSDSRKRSASSILCVDAKKQASGSFFIPKEQADDQDSQGLTSVPGTPFVDSDFDAEVAADGSSIELRNGNQEDLYLASGANVSEAKADIIQNLQLGPSWVTYASIDETSNRSLSAHEPQTDCMQDMQKLQLDSWSTCKNNVGSECRNSIQSVNNLHTELDSGSEDEERSELDTQYSYIAQKHEHA
ncbi:hypothetical protein M406DRAFT_71384 [Cryphonectria parasitica EP155]|uniref:Protein kinase domain-containing protein n=1 Tax=Cryphonectria parasitica (strain ATCC 38755 / EP155) TaxID=660469 RepID=A0A9P4Y948_CRYP1|nr:uncharacterized protein M406DRAFT_71384 [Cryphonectria parasitica EP155]KAF3768330.1 hypothetical protein M406DRAFT_71384 [Cryphonectria parasitica EP155]